ncbi:lipopolysaccharide biosynthesis protein [Clostridium perfringens]
MNNNEIKNKTVKGLIWTFLDLTLNQGLQFVIQIILARLLIPEQFGLIGIITVFIAISNSVVDSGFSNALIREKKVNQEDYSTVFYFNLITAMIMYLILYFLAPMISIFFSEPLLKNMLRVLAITLIINSFGLIQKTMMIRKLEFRTQMIINIISSIVSGIITIIMAYKGFGIWCLVFRMIILQGMQSILLCLINKWIPSLTFSIKSFKRLFGFGWRLLISGLIDTIYNNLYYVIIGKIYTPVDLGYYTNAQKLRDVSSNSISVTVQKVTYPVLSGMQNEKNLKEVYRKMIKNATYITFPIMIGLLVVAKPLILLLFGESWEGSISYFKILCLAGMLYPLHSLNLNILQVKGRSDLFLKLEVLKKIVSIITVIIAIIFKFNIIGLLWVMVLNSVICFFINSYYSKELINYSTIEQLADILKTFFVTVIMGTITTWVSIFISSYGNFGVLSIQVLVGISVYIIISKILNLDEFNTLFNLINIRGKKC